MHITFSLTTNIKALLRNDLYGWVPLNNTSMLCVQKKSSGATIIKNKIVTKNYYEKHSSSDLKC